MLFNDPHWLRASEWLSRAKTGGVGIMGVPLNASISPGRCDLAPGAIREALTRFSPYDPGADLDVSTLGIKDWGDLHVSTARESVATIADALELPLQQSEAMVLLGGDNAITRPGVRALGRIDRVGLITFDAHFDLRDLSLGYINGNPIRALLDDGLPGSQIVQIGIQAFANSAPYGAVAREAGIEFVTAPRVHAEGIGHHVERALVKLSEAVDAIYIDLDIDVLDRSFAPACPGSRPGGLMPWQLREAVRICGRHHKVRMMDIVEIDPRNDVADSTVLNAAACLLEFCAGVRER
ncbi:MAG: agmatinase family protein [Armatimonadetes bacterium]|nr:agmatinase family protein [Armatimonadota bacterium]